MVSAKLSSSLRSLLSPVVWGILLPPLLLLGWVVVSPVTLGNDYALYPTIAPQSLRFYVEEGIEPMWYPHQTGGIPAGGLFYAQYFHLPAWLLSRLPGFWSGEAMRLLAARHLLLIAATHALYFVALRRGVGLGRGTSWLLSLVLVYNLRTLDLFRYGIALDAGVYLQGAWVLSLLHVLRPSPWLLGLVTIATQLLSTSGYPVLVPFAALAALPAVPLLARIVGLPTLVRRGGQVLAAAAAGVLLAAPHWMALSEWMSVNYFRVAKPSLEWAAAADWSTFPSSLPVNLVFPWEAEVHSAFAGSTLQGAVLLAVVIALVRERSGLMLAALAFPFLYALGTLTPVFPFFFEHVPGFATLRVPGKAMFMLPLLVLLGLVWLRRRGTLLLAGSVPRAAALLVAIAAVLGLLRVAMALPFGSPVIYSPASLSDWWTPGWQAVWLALGLIAGLSLLRLAKAPSRVAAAMLTAATLAQLVMVMRHGTWTADRERSPGREAFHNVSHLPLYASFPLLANNDLRLGADATATVAYTHFLQKAEEQADCFLPVHKGSRHVRLPFYLSDHLECVESRPGALERLRVPNDCTAGALRTLVLASACPATERPGNEGLASLNARNHIFALTPNLATLEVDTPREAVLVTPFPEATANWSGWLDGQPSPLLSINAGFVGLRVPAGRHRVSVRYFSGRMVIAYRIAFTTGLVLAAAILGVAAAGRMKSAEARGILGIALLVLAAAAVHGYRRWEHRFVERARRETVFNHNYPVLLEQQLARWSQEPGLASPPGAH